ncbi:amidohydrolase [Nocardioides rubriscoriae]|uniref:amidohydrolase n=1 Tax=Nocardioides rubriscoriae TaxID=642762 RepID=UPI0011E02773|nr:amidohydrolase family protein [Nocardioides rubriscoriae]
MADLPAAPARQVLRGGVVLVGGEPATAVGVEGGRIAFVGSEVDADRWTGTGEGAPVVTDLDGALVAPAFVDAHVHTVRTGFATTGLDLTGTPTLVGALDALAAHAAAAPDAGVLVGQGWDETDWPESRPPTGAELDRAAPGRRTYVTRVDGHSSVISPALASLVPGLEQLDGWTPDGRVERDAHHAVRATLESLISDAERLDAARAGCRAMATQGIVALHENAAPHIGPESEIALVRQAAAETGLHAVVYWGELMAADTARRLGVAGLAGDLIADGAFGSRTAALATPYDDAPHTCGHGYVTAEQVRDHVVACSHAGLQAGFHAIGDAALEEIATGFELAAAVVGDALCALRLEHVELPSPRVVDVIARLGVVCSVQPVFDALWGGPDGMYADRLGERWAQTNPFAELARHTTLALGSDSPVTALGPWAAVRAAVHHHAPEHALTPAVAFAAHTRGGWAAAGQHDRADHLRAGDVADLAVWRTPAALVDGLPDLTPGTELPTLVRLLAAGRTVHEGAPA